MIFSTKIINGQCSALVESKLKNELLCCSLSLLPFVIILCFFFNSFKILHIKFWYFQTKYWQSALAESKLKNGLLCCSLLLLPFCQYLVCFLFNSFKILHIKFWYFKWAVYVCHHLACFLFNSFKILHRLCATIGSWTPNQKVKASIHLPLRQVWPLLMLIIMPTHTHIYIHLIKQ